MSRSSHVGSACSVCPTTIFWGGLFYLKGCLQIWEFEKISVINNIIRHCTNSTVFKYTLLLVGYFSNVYRCFFVIIFIWIKFTNYNILIWSGCYKKIPQTGGLNKRHLFLIIPKAGRSRCWPIQFLARALFLACRELPSHCVLLWQRERAQALCYVFL